MSARAAERRRRVAGLLREEADQVIWSRLSINGIELTCDLSWLYRRHGVKGQGSRRALAE